MEQSLALHVDIGPTLRKHLASTDTRLNDEQAWDVLQKSYRAGIAARDTLSPQAEGSYLAPKVVERTDPGSDSSGSSDEERVQIRPSRSQQRRARRHERLAYSPRPKTSSVAALRTHNFWTSLELDASPGKPDSNSSGEVRTRSPVGNPIPATEKIGPREKKEAPTAPAASEATPSSKSSQEEPEAEKADSTDAERVQFLKT